MGKEAIYVKENHGHWIWKRKMWFGHHSKSFKSFNHVFSLFPVPHFFFFFFVFLLFCIPDFFLFLFRICLFLSFLFCLSLLWIKGEVYSWENFESLFITFFFVSFLLVSIVINISIYFNPSIWIKKIYA